MRRRSNTAGTLALMVAAAGVFGSVAFSAWSDRGGESTVHAVVRTDPAGASSRVHSSPLEVVGARSAVADPTVETRTAATAATQSNDGFHASLRVVDDRTGLTVPTAWFQRSQFGALDRRAERHDAAPGRGPARIWIDGAQATVLVAAPKYRTQDVTLDQAGVHEVRLERTTSLVGTVRDGQSAPVPAARVTLEFLGSTLDGITEDSPALAIKGPTLRRTDAEGRFVFTNLAPGVYRTVAVADGAEKVSRPRLLLDGEWLETDHWLDEATRIAVLVDRPDGVPAARARLLLGKQGATEPALTRYTDADGRATLGPLDPGTYDVSVQSADGACDPRTFTIEGDGCAVVDLHLQLAAASAPRD